MQRVEFEWAISEPDENNLVQIRERLAGTDLCNLYGPLPKAIAESFIRARRDFIYRTITTKLQATKIFEARPNLEALSLLQKKGHLDS